MWETSASECGLRLFQDADVAGDLTRCQRQGECCVFFGSHTFVPTSWTYKKETAV